MTKRDFFKITLRGLGVYIIIYELLYLIPSMIQYLMLSTELGWFSFIPLGVSLLFQVVIYFVFVYKPEIIIKLFQLDKSYDEDTIIIGNFNFQGVMLFAIALISIYILLTNTPSFITELIKAFADKVGLKKTDMEVIINGASNFETPKEISYYPLIQKGIILVCAYLLLTNAKKVTAWLERKNVTEDAK